MIGTAEDVLALFAADFYSYLSTHSHGDSCYTMISYFVCPMPAPCKMLYIFAFKLEYNSFNFSMSAFCAGHPIPNPSVWFGFGII